MDLQHWVLASVLSRTEEEAEDKLRQLAEWKIWRYLYYRGSGSAVDRCDRRDIRNGHFQRSYRFRAYRVIPAPVWKA